MHHSRQPQSDLYEVRLENMLRARTLAREFDKKRIVASQQVYTFELANTSYQILKETLGRRGLVIVNVNAAATVFQMFGQPNQASAIPFLPNEKRVMDFVTPTDALFMYSDTAGAKVCIEEDLEL